MANSSQEPNGLLQGHVWHTSDDTWFGLGNVGALIIGVPIGLATAIFLAEMAHPKQAGSSIRHTTSGGNPIRHIGFIGLIILVPS